MQNKMNACLNNSSIIQNRAQKRLEIRSVLNVIQGGDMQ